VLEPLGREVVTAPSGEEALKRLLQDDFSVIVMDVRMPGLNGFQTVEMIKRRDRHENTAVIFLTAADADAEQVTRGYSAGAVDYMLKPVDPDMLRSKVAMLLELQQKSAELRASEERFRAAFEGAPIGMGLSTVHGRWLEVNDALCELLGRTQTHLLRQPLWDLVHPDDLPGVRERMASIGTEGIVTLEYRLRRADGEYEWVETTARRVGDEIQCSSRGVTERRAASAQLARRLDLLRSRGLQHVHVDEHVVVHHHGLEPLDEADPPHVGRQVVHLGDAVACGHGVFRPAQVEQQELVGAARLELGGLDVHSPDPVPQGLEIRGEMMPDEAPRAGHEHFAYAPCHTTLRDRCRSCV